MLDLSTVHHLCFGVGGANGWIFIGCIENLERAFVRQKKSLYAQLEGASGSSVGSLFALAMVMNYGAIEFREFLKSCMDRYKDEIKINILSLQRHKGILDLDVLKRIVEDMLTAKFGSEHANMTMSELYKHTERSCIIMTHNLSLSRSEVIDEMSFPDLPVSKAICMSCAIPGICHAIEHAGCVYTDAGISNGLPFEFFPLETTLVFNLYSGHGYVSPEEMSMPDFFCRIVHAFDTLTSYKLEQVPQELRYRVLTLDVPCCLQHALAGFVLSDEDRDRLISVGLHGSMTLFHRNTALVSQALVMYLRTAAEGTRPPSETSTADTP